MRPITRACCLLFLAALSGCGPRVELLYRAEGFDYPSLASGGVALGGVANTVGDLQSRAANRHPFTELLESILISQRRDLRVMMAAGVRDGLGEEAYGHMLDHYERTGELDLESIAALDTLLASQVRYVAVARVEDRTIERNQVEVDPDGDRSTSNSTHTKYTHCDLRVGFHVYDVRSKELTWSGRITGTATDSVSYSEDSGPFLLGVLISILGGGKEPDHPPPPEMSRMLPEVFEAFAAGLPGPKR